MFQYRPLTALNHLSKMPKFDRAFHKFLWKKVQREADKGCRLLSEPGPSAFLREDVENFEPDDYYDLFCSTFPTFMISLVAVAVKGPLGKGYGNLREFVQVCPLSHSALLL